jgi:hypothetical protein
MNMKAELFAALSGWAAALVAATLAAIQFFIGRRQAQAALTSAQAALMNARTVGRYKIAEFRQNWINKVIDTLCEHHAIIMSSDVNVQLPVEDRKKLAASRTRLEILLNPDEEDTVALVEAIDLIGASKSGAERDDHADEMLTVARRLLKREWDRIKQELGPESTVH